MSRKKITHGTRKLLARNVRLLRTAHGWSQETLAARTGLHRTYISQVEHQLVNVRLETLERLADVFELELGQLLSPVTLDDLRRRFKHPGVEEPRAVYEWPAVSTRLH